MRRLVIALVALSACSNPTAPTPTLACVLVANPPMPNGWTAAVWVSPVQGVACVIPRQP